MVLKEEKNNHYLLYPYLQGESFVKTKIILMGAAGREFHNFNMFFRDNPDHEVVAFTAAQIPNIAGRKYPKELAGELYPHGIPIYPEERLKELIARYRVDSVVFSYSDVSHEYVMHKASLVLSCGANFVLLGPKATMLKSTKPVIAVCAVRTGAGKSPTTRRIADILRKKKKKVVIIRHPMPYGDLRKQILQRFATHNDLDKYKTTIEEREDYEPHIEKGFVVYSGVDYKKILEEAEKEADIIIWDGGNNDLPFIKPDLHFVLADPHRAGHEMLYHPGEANLRMADVVVISKVSDAKQRNVETVMKNIKEVNPRAKIIKANLELHVDNPKLIKRKKVLCLEDGPTLTHGGMAFGAAFRAARRFGAKEIVNPKRYSVGSIREVYNKYPHLEKVLPAMGYNKNQIKELEKTINNAKCDTVIIGTPTDIRRFMNINKPTVRVTYETKEISKPDLENVIDKFLLQMKLKKLLMKK